MLRFVVPALLAAGLFVSRPAAAHPDFPPAIDTDLGLTGSVILESVYPPSGCQLCHTSPAGGTLSLTPFGDLLVDMYGVSSSALIDDPTQLTAALAAMQMQDPTLVTDLKTGKDPSDDVHTSVLLMPEYGCSAAPGSPGGCGAVLLAVAAAALRRGRRRGGVQ